MTAHLPVLFGERTWSQKSGRNHRGDLRKIQLKSYQSTAISKKYFKTRNEKLIQACMTSTYTVEGFHLPPKISCACDHSYLAAWVFYCEIVLKTVEPPHRFLLQKAHIFKTLQLVCKNKMVLNSLCKRAFWQFSSDVSYTGHQYQFSQQLPFINHNYGVFDSLFSLSLSCSPDIS